MRGRPPKPDICRVCSIPITRINSKQERICPECATERVMLDKWSKRTDEDIIQHIQSMSKTIILMGRILKDRGYYNA